MGDRTALVGQEQVGGLDVAMDEAGGVGGVEGAGDLGQQVGRQARVERPSLEPIVEVGALDVAHGQERGALGLTGLVDGDDVGVVDRGRQLRLAQEAGAERLVVCVFGGEQLEGHLAPELALLGEVDDAHAAAPQDALDAIRPEVGAEA